MFSRCVARWCVPTLWLVIACGGQASSRDPNPPEPSGGGTAEPGSEVGGAGGAGSGLYGAGAGASSESGEGGLLQTAGAAGMLAESVWRMSNAAFCVEGTGAPHSAVDLWSDEAGVYLLLDEQLYENRGEGWKLFRNEGRGGPGGIAGAIGDALMLYGGATVRCGIELMGRTGRTRCSAVLAGPRDVFVVQDDLAYAANADQVHVFDGTRWDPWDAERVLDGRWIQRLWANERTLLLATTDGVFVSRDGQAPELQDLPEAAGSDFSAAWGFADDDLWVGSSTGQLFRFQGERWTLEWSNTAEAACARVTEIWGSEGQLFFHTPDGLYWHRTDGSTRTLARRPCVEGRSAFQSVWGNSPVEVFVAEQSDGSGACGEILLSWFDGTSLSPL